MNTKNNPERKKPQKVVVFRQRLRKVTLENWDMWATLHDPGNYKHELREMPVTRHD